MPGKLVKAPPTNEAVLAKRLEVSVTSKAEPRSENLVQARAYLQSDPELKRIREQFIKEGASKEWLTDAMAVRLGGLWDDTSTPFSEILETATYLADEADQLGEGIFLASTETGKIQIVLDEDDIYQPAPVPREGGGMAVPLKRIRPDLESAIVCHIHEQAREERILQRLREKLPQTRLIVDGEDSRLRIATRRGRSAIVESVSKLAPKTLLEAAGGTAGTFLKSLDIVTEDRPPDPACWDDLGDDVAVARSKLGIQDPTTFNLSYNREAVLRGTIPQEWARKMARRLADAVHKSRPPIVATPADELSLDDLHEIWFWLLPPDAIGPFKRIDPRIQAMPVEGIQPVGIVSGNVLGVLVVAESFGAASKELFARWETEAHLEYKLYVNQNAVFPLRVTGLAHAAVVV